MAEKPEFLAEAMSQIEVLPSHLRHTLGAGGGVAGDPLHVAPVLDLPTVAGAGTQHAEHRIFSEAGRARQR
jgi:hypothetical protein